LGKYNYKTFEWNYWKCDRTLIYIFFKKNNRIWNNVGSDLRKTWKKDLKKLESTSL